MPAWLGLLLALAAVLVLAPFVARFGSKHGRRLKGGAMLLLGLGSFYDPPKRSLMEAHQEKEEPGQESREPKDLPQEPPAR